MIQWQIDTAAGKSIDGTTTLQKLGFRIEGEAWERTGEKSGVGAQWAPPHKVFGISNFKSFNLVLCIVKRVILKKTTFQRKHRKIFQTNELNQPPMLKALIKIGGQMLEGSSPPTPQWLRPWCLSRHNQGSICGETRRGQYWMID